jgi:cellobiose-specific phosphotransferase system component IIC
VKRFLKAIAHVFAPLLSRRLAMTIFGLYVLWLIHWANVQILFEMTNPTQITAFQALTLAMYSGVVGLVMWFVGNSTWKGGFSVAAAVSALTQASSTAETQTVNVTEKVDDRIVQQFAQRYAGDDSYRPIQPDTEAPFR